MHKPIKYVEKAVTLGAKGHMGGIRSLESHQAEPVANAEVV